MSVPAPVGRCPNCRAAIAWIPCCPVRACRPGPGAGRFSLSRDGQVQVGWGRRLAATEFEALGDGQPGLAMLEPEEIRYLEAYLLWQGRRWSDAEDGIDAGPGEASAFDPFSGQARTRACVAESAGLSGLRILHTEAATSFGGQEFCIYKEMVAMRERGHHLEAVCQPQAELGGRLREAGFKVHNLLMDGPVNFLRGVSALRRVLRGGRFDVLNTHSRRDTVLASIGARLAGTPLIVRTRHLAKPIHSLYAYTWLAHRVIAVSRYVRGQLLEGGARPGGGRGDPFAGVPATGPAGRLPAPRVVDSAGGQGGGLRGGDAGGKGA